MWPLFFIALAFAYKKDLKEYVEKYDKKGQYVIYVFIIGLIVVSLAYSVFKWIEA